jgi:hypothetical protein
MTGIVPAHKLGLIPAQVAGNNPVFVVLGSGIPALKAGRNLAPSVPWRIRYPGTLGGEKPGTFITKDMAS